MPIHIFFAFISQCLALHVAFVIIGFAFLGGASQCTASWPKEVFNSTDLGNEETQKAKDSKRGSVQQHSHLHTNGERLEKKEKMKGRSRRTR